MTEYMTKEEVKAYLELEDVSVENWLFGGEFLGAMQDENGEWKFEKEAVQIIKEHCDVVKQMNAEGELLSSNIDEDDDRPLF